MTNTTIAAMADANGVPIPDAIFLSFPAAMTAYYTAVAIVIN
jgi:hypothetical protein